MNAKHTPGPWKVERKDYSIDLNGHPHHYWEIVSPSDDRGIAIVVLPDEDRTRKTVAERKASARLIAAAPEMYEMLEALISGIDHWNEEIKKITGRYADYSWGDLETARAVLAKARDEVIS